MGHPCGQQAVHEPTVWLRGKVGLQHPGLCLEEDCQQVKRGDPSPLVSPGEATPGVLCSVVGSLVWESKWSSCPYLNPPGAFFVFSPPVLCRRGSDRAAWWAPRGQPRSTHHTSLGTGNVEGKKKKKKDKREEIWEVFWRFRKFGRFLDNHFRQQDHWHYKLWTQLLISLIFHRFVRMALISRKHLFFKRLFWAWWRGKRLIVLTK